MKTKTQKNITFLMTVILTVSMLSCKDDESVKMPLDGNGNNNSTTKSIAEKYPQDVKIESDPDVVFTEMFEAASISNMMVNWDQQSKTSSNIVFDESIPKGSLGAQSLRLVTVDDGTNASENTFIYKKIIPEITDSIFVRFYIKYDINTVYHHSGVYIGGKNPVSSTAGFMAGVLPQGNAEFHVGAEIKGNANKTPSQKSIFGFYNYWMGMHPYTTGPNAGFYYGNEFLNSRNNDVIDLASWNCVEIMIRLNNPVTASNGELKIWINGLQISYLGYQFPDGKWSEAHFIEGFGSPFEGFQWRNDDGLKLNYVWLKNFNDENKANHSGNIYFDHLVIAKRYIGPIWQ